MNPRAVVTGLAALPLVLFAIACASTAESPEPTPQQSVSSSPTAAVSPTAAACPTPPATPPASVQYQTDSSAGIGTLTRITIERQECVDRVTFTFADNLPGYNARYVQAATQCGSGEPVTTAGPAQLEVTFIPANAHDESGQPTVTERSLMPNYPSIKQAELACDFEAHVSWVFGTEEHYFNVATSQSPPQLVLDVYH